MCQSLQVRINHWIISTSVKNEITFDYAGVLQYEAASNEDGRADQITSLLIRRVPDVVSPTY